MTLTPAIATPATATPATAPEGEMALASATGNGSDTDPTSRVGRRGRPRRRTVALFLGASCLLVFGGSGAFGSTVGELLGDVAHALRHAHPVAIAVAIGFSLVSVLNRGRLHQEAHRSVELDARLGPMVLVSSAAYALNKIAKTAGAGGVAVFVRHGLRYRRSAGSVTAAYMVASICAQLGLGIVVGSAFLTALRSGSPGRIWAGTAVGFGIWLLITAAVVGVVLRSRARVHQVFAVAVRLADRVARRVGRRVPGSSVAVVDDFFDAAVAVRRHPGAFLRALLFATLDKFLGALVLTYALLAAGASVSFTTVLQAFAVALVAATVGVLPAGLGAVEASMVALLTQRGVDLPTASAAVVIFRLIDLWVPLLVGSVAARSLLRSNPPAGTTADPDAAIQPIPAESLAAESLAAESLAAETLTAEPLALGKEAPGEAMIFSDLLKSAPDSVAEIAPLPTRPPR